MISGGLKLDDNLVLRFLGGNLKLRVKGTLFLLEARKIRYGESIFMGREEKFLFLV